MIERVIRMSHRVVITAIRLRHLRVAVIMRLLRIVAVMAVMMVGHVRIHIRLIVVQIHRFRLRVIGREITVVIWRRPYSVGRATVDIPHRRTFDEHRTNDVVIAV